METIVIESKYCGPSTSANGGYTAGILAARLAGPQVTVEATLLAPPPIAIELYIDVDADGQSARLLDETQVVASARVVTPLDITTPPPISFSDAALEQASPVVLDPDSHPFNSCFVCGTARDPSDALRIFPAELVGHDLMVAAYQPAERYCAPEFVWAALDCPSSFPMYLASQPFSGPAVLGRMTMTPTPSLTPGGRYVIQAWRERIDGRKLMAAAALYDESGEVVAAARATWIRLR